jgi:triosephosphate isomerase (TIM)
MSAGIRRVLAGNWKMHHGPVQAAKFIESFLERYPARDDQEIVFFPPALSMSALAERVASRDDVVVGVQNIYWEPKGAFTGEISAPMAGEAGAQLVLVGHSERRHVFGETIEETVRKVDAALGSGLRVVLCVGETIEERRSGRAEEVVAEQLEPVLRARNADDARRVLVAYEPVWAIGTGETATPQDAAAMHEFVRSTLVRHWGEGAGGGVPILYGGSVKPDNAAELLRASEVNGVLVGGASLEADSFAAICSALA